MTLRRETRQAILRWNSLCTDCPAPVLPEQPLEALRASEALIELMREAQRWVNEFSPSLETEIQGIFADLNVDGILEDPSRMEALATAIDIRLKCHRLSSSREEVKRLREIFKSEPLPVFSKAVAFLEHLLGNPRHDSMVVEKAGNRSWRKSNDSMNYRPISRRSERLLTPLVQRALPSGPNDSRLSQMSKDPSTGRRRIGLLPGSGVANSVIF